MLSAAVDLTLSGHIYKRQFDGSIDSARVVVALRHIFHHAGLSVKQLWLL